MQSEAHLSLVEALEKISVVIRGTKAKSEYSHRDEIKKKT